MSLNIYYDNKSKTLNIPYFHNEELKEIPKGTQIIIFKENYEKQECSKFNKNINNLPDSITHLTLGFKFNRNIDKLPNSITHLILGESFNKDVDKLPNSITHLVFGGLFNKNINNLPNSIMHLTLGYYFNHKIDNLPTSIISLTIGHDFDKISDNLPVTLKEIKVVREEQVKLIKKIPVGCRVLESGFLESGFLLL